MRSLATCHQLFFLLAGVSLILCHEETAFAQFRGVGIYFHGPGSIGVGVGSFHPAFGIGSTSLDFGVGYPGFSASGLAYQVGIPSYRPLGYPRSGLALFPPPFPIPPRAAIIVPNVSIYRDVYSARVPYQQPSVPYREPYPQYLPAQIFTDPDRPSDVRPGASVQLNSDGTPAGELRPGMVLPDGAIVLSVGPLSSQTSPNQPPTFDPNTKPSLSSPRTHSPQATTPPSTEAESIEPEVIPIPTSKVD